MKLTILSYGSRGDVQPFIALSVSLLADGFEVTLAAPENFKGLITSYGIPYAPLAGDFHAMFSSEEGQRYLRSGSTVKFLANQQKMIHRLRHALERDLLAACQDADGIIADVVLAYHATCLIEKYQLPLLTVALVPWVPPTGDFAYPLLATMRLPGFLNRLTFKLHYELVWRTYRSDIIEWREELGLATNRAWVRLGGSNPRIPVVHAYSKHLLPVPPNPTEGDTYAGFFRVPAMPENTVSDELSHWLEQEDAPIFLGFGSMPIADWTGVRDLAEGLSSELGRRVIVGAGWSGLKETPSLADNVFVVGEVDHWWLFPRCSCLVHHGGAGTLATGLYAGVPTVVCSVFSDQPFWGTRVQELGVGRHIRFKHLSKERLVRAVREASCDKVRGRATALGEKLRGEDGVAAAVEAVKARFGGAPASGAEASIPQR